MTSWIERFTRYCMAQRIISPVDYDWFKYGLEKRISTLIVAIPFFSLAVVLSDVFTAIAFFISFFCLRSRTNGYHAKTVGLCFLFSLLFEIFFLGVLNPLLTMFGMLVLSAVSTIVLLILAPYNHPNMHLSTKEMEACRTSSRIRSCGILLVVIAFWVINRPSIARGCALGLAMATCLLCLAYIVERRKNTK